MHGANQYVRRIVWLMLVNCLAVITSFAHPGSGIVVDREGNVYFVDTGQGVWRIDRQGRLIPHEGPAYHWMTIDLKGRFDGASLPQDIAADLTVVGTNPTLILGGDFPLTMGHDGALYYPEREGDRHVRIMRLLPSGARNVFANLPAPEDSAQHWVHGIAAGRDGAIYYADRNSVRKISSDGTITPVATDIAVPDCNRPPAAAEERLGPALRGLDIGPDGTIYVAAAGCCALLKITPEGAITVVLRASSPWSPTGVAVAGDDLYVLEYLHILTEDRKNWVPRVRKLSRDGSVAVVATVQRR